MTKLEKTINVENFLKERGLSLDSFYVVTIGNYDMKLQGNNESPTIKKLSDCCLTVDAQQGWICGSFLLPSGLEGEAPSSFKIDITLT